ncbi:MAG: DMT family transporter [Desulfobacteraceae bacterium]|nr:MAG: DMT family transporter [Desulfobacteraceae bacterium]
MNRQVAKSDGILLLTALIWGVAFVAQRVGMEFVGPFTFNGIRFALGSLVLVPFILKNNYAERRRPAPGFREIGWGGAAAGVVLFTGASLQQVGLVFTTAGNAGFITGLYVVFVPVLGLFFGQKTDAGTWLGTFLAASGLYLLSITEGFHIAFGDLLELLGAFVWAGHVLIIGWLSPRFSAVKLAFFQFAACSALSLATAALFEPIALTAVYHAGIPILYGGLLSVGVAYTLQVVAQKNAHPTHAAILLSLEAVFAAIGGGFLLGETLTTRGFIGCALMLSGMLLSQLWGSLQAAGSFRKNLFGRLSSKRP